MINAQNISSIKVGIDSTAAKSGAAEVGAALKSIENSLKSLQRIMKETAKAAGATGGGTGDAATGGKKTTAAVAPGAARNIKETNDGLQMFMGLLNKVRNTLFVLYLVREAFDGITSAMSAVISTGIAFNDTMEQAVVGTGGLIAQLSTLSRQGVELKGIESIRAGMEIAKEEVLALQIAGLQTAATSEALVVAFQQAVGPGLAAGLAVKEIRDFTIDTVQAASALGVPMHQIAQEVRAILEGSIDPNARVAKALQIDSADIKKWKEAGTLVENLNKALATFRDIGPIMERTWAGATSNVQELTSSLAGLATSPLFDEIKKSLVEINDEVRRGGAGKQATSLLDVFSPTIQNDIVALQIVFEHLGQTADEVLGVLVDRIMDVFDAFAADPAAIDALNAAITHIGDALIGLFETFSATQVIDGFIQFIDDLGTIIEWVTTIIDLAVRAWRIFKDTIALVLAPILQFLVAISQLTLALIGATTWTQAWSTTVEESNNIAKNAKFYQDQLVESLSSTPVNQIESDQQRIQAAYAATGGQIGTLSTELQNLNGKWVEANPQWLSTELEKNKAGKWVERGTAKLKLGQPIGTQGLLEGWLTGADTNKTTVTNKPVAPAVDKGAADKAKRAREKAEAEERAFQLAKLQRIEQVARDEVDYQEKINKVLLKQNEELYDAKFITAKEYADKKVKLEMEGAESEKRIALLRATGAASITSKTLKGLVPDNMAAMLQGGEAELQALRDTLDAATPKTQQQAEALREMTQAVVKLQEALFGLRQARGDFDVRTLGEFKPPPTEDVTPTREEALRERRLHFAAQETAIRRRLDLEQQILTVQNAETRGQITQAEAAERLIDLADQKNKYEIAGLEYELKQAKAAYDAVETERLSLEILQKKMQILRVSNSDAFFKGLNQNLDKLSDKFEKLGSDIRSIFRDAFEELGRTGFKGFVDTFLNGIADALRTRAADALSQVVAKIFTDLGKVAAAKTGIGGWLEKILGKLLDPLGRSKAGTAGQPGTATGLPTAADKDVVLDDIPGVVDQNVLLGNINRDTTGILREVMDAAASLREMKACCAEHNSLLKQQMQASKGPGLLGQLLSAAAGAAAGGLVGGWMTPSGGEGNLTAGDYEGGAPGLPVLPDLKPTLPLMPAPPIAPGGIPGQVTNNFTIVTPNPAAFNAPQTQAQIASMMSATLQKSQNMVGSINNPNTPK